MTEEKKKIKKTIVRKSRAKKIKVEVVEPTDIVSVSAETIAETVKGGSVVAAIGRRKTSIARVHVVKNGKGTITVNGKAMETYFPTYELRSIIIGPLKVAGQETSVDVSILVDGGGIHGQAEAVRLGIARALIEINPVFRKSLKKLGYLTRDPRAKERKKFGLKRARRAPQWSKR